MFTFSVVVVDLPTDCILSFLFPAETDILVPVFSQSTDVVVVNFVVVLKFPINKIMTTKSEGDLIRDGEVVGDDEMLSPKLEGYTLTTKRKWLIDTFKIY